MKLSPKASLEVLVQTSPSHDKKHEEQSVLNEGQVGDRKRTVHGKSIYDNLPFIFLRWKFLVIFEDFRVHFIKGQPLLRLIEYAEVFTQVNH